MSAREHDEAFQAAHLKAFGYNYAGQQKIEIVNFSVSGFGMIERPTIPKLAADKAAKPPYGTRKVYFGGAFQDTPIYDRSTLAAGFRLDGPAVVEEFGSVIAAGGAGVVIASQSGHRLPALTAEQDKALATTPADELLDLLMLQPDQK